MRRQLDTFDQLKCFNPLDRPNRCPNGSVGPIPSSTLVGDGNSRNEESTTASTIANRHEMVIEPQANATGATWVELWLVTVIILLLLVVAFT